MLFDAISDINGKITSHSEQVDGLEMKLLEVNKKRKQRNVQKELEKKEREARQLNIKVQTKK